MKQMQIVFCMGGEQMLGSLESTRDNRHHTQTVQKYIKSSFIWIPTEPWYNLIQENDSWDIFCIDIFKNHPNTVSLYSIQFKIIYNELLLCKVMQSWDIEYLFKKYSTYYLPVLDDSFENMILGLQAWPITSIFLFNV